MSRSAPTHEPSHLGPYALTGRLAETAAGIVYQGVDPHGRQISLAVLNQGAAADAAARDRFRAAILAEPLYADPPQGTAAIVGAEPEGPTPWVATLHEPGARGAERFLAPVLLDPVPLDPGVSLDPTPLDPASPDGVSRPATRRHGPLFQPYWLGARDPALSPPRSRHVPVHDRTVIATIVTVAALLVAVALLLLLLFACQPPPPPSPPPPSPSPASPTPTQSTPSPSPSRLSPSPTRTRSGSPPPTQTDGGGAGDSA
jgi:hypothetical protein